MIMKAKPFIGLFFSVLLITMLSTAVVTGETEKCPGTVKVLVETIGTDTFLEYKNLESKALPWKSIDFSCSLPGTVVRIEKNVGSDIDAGDVVAIVDEAPIKKEIAEAKTKILSWKKELYRRQNWRVRSERAEQQAKLSINKYTGLLAQKQAELENVQITAPDTGRLDVLNVKEGDFISKGFVVGNIVNIDNVRIPLGKYSENVAEGQKIKVTIIDLSTEVEGTVMMYEGGKNCIVIENSAKNILHGMKVRFRLLVETHENAVVLPKEKILEDGENSFVYIAEGKLAKKALLKTGPVENGMVLIKDGLAAGDELIVSEILSAKQGTVKEKLACLDDNKKIRVLEMDPGNGRFVKRKKGKAAPGKVNVKKEPKVKHAKPAPQSQTPQHESNINALISYLNSNKSTLGYEKFKQVTRKGSTHVTIYCTAEVWDKLLPVIRKLDVEKYCFVKDVSKKRKAEKISRPSAYPMRDAGPSSLLNKFRVGASVGYYRMTDENFEDIYGRMISLGLDISFMLSDKLDLLFYGGTSSKTSRITYDFTDKDMQFKFTPLTLDLRYFIMKSKKLDVFAGAGLNYYPFEDQNVLEDVKSSAMGFNFLGGTYYKLTERFALQFMLRFNFVKKEIEGADNDLNLNSAELLFGLSVRL